MIDFTQIIYILIMMILVSFLFSFWLIVVWIGLVHCYIYLTEWRNQRNIAKVAKRDYFEKIEEFRNEFK